MSTAPATFRLTQPIEEESIFVRAQSLIDAHAKGTLKTLSNNDRRVIAAVVRRAKRAAKAHPNTGVEISPYMVALMRLED